MIRELHNNGISENTYRIIIVFLIISILLISSILLSDAMLTRSIDAGSDLIGGNNHEDTITTPFPGSSCPCGYPDCSCPSDNGIAITLQVTAAISPLPGIGEVATPEIPTGATTFATVTGFPTFVFPEQPTLEPTPGATVAGATPTLSNPFPPSTPLPWSGNDFD